MKKANTIEEPKDILVEATEEALDLLKTNLKFPVDLARQKMLATLQDVRSNIQYFENQNKEYLAAIASNAQSLRLEEEREKLIVDDLPVETFATQEEMQLELESVARLPWVEKVGVDGYFVVVTTRKDMLKTRFDTRLVMLPRNRWTMEHIPEPVIASMPQYQIRIDTTHLGHNFSNTISLGIRLADDAEISQYEPNLIAGHERQMHWGSSGARGAGGNWGHICLGEYSKDIQEASKKNLVTLFNELSVYLQNAGDGGNAYRTKHNWAMGLGKALYYEFLTRKAESGETKEGIEEQYKKDFKMMNPVPEGTRTVDQASSSDTLTLASLARAWNSQQHVSMGMMYPPVQGHGGISAGSIIIDESDDPASTLSYE